MIHQYFNIKTISTLLLLWAKLPQALFRNLLSIQRSFFKVNLGALRFSMMFLKWTTSNKMTNMITINMDYLSVNHWLTKSSSACKTTPASFAQTLLLVLIRLRILHSTSLKQILKKKRKSNRISKEFNLGNRILNLKVDPPQ